MTFTVGNLFPSHSCIGWPTSRSHWDLVAKSSGCRRLSNWAIPSPLPSAYSFMILRYAHVHIYKQALTNTLLLIYSDYDLILRSWLKISKTGLPWRKKNIYIYIVTRNLSSLSRWLHLCINCLFIYFGKWSSNLDITQHRELQGRPYTLQLCKNWYFSVIFPWWDSPSAMCYLTNQCIAYNMSIDNQALSVAIYITTLYMCLLAVHIRSQQS